ncbi:LANO_0F08350g1_1 [Lachancea nothofagi CBS 11611]|uniref:LANO_0F08350g1_1 n=1 Tax=Lachancea nothofagi CBS 11611 TaxID=1266666 RepID=A0A1G4K9G1_9SACH|nr:LANO_0F08350g1_1 [Lachancea nothofagi CBS 11611]
MGNLYTRRTVAQKDAQPCMICFTPTTCVLFNSSIQDWFHCCEIHFQDNPGFAKPVYPASYHDAMDNLKVVKQQLDTEKSQGARTWDSWVNKMISRKPSKEDVKSEVEAEAKDDSRSKEETLGSEYQELLDKISKLRKELRTYSLSQIMYESRLDAKKRNHSLKAKLKREQDAYTNTNPDDLQAKFAFPTVPQR